MNYLPPYGLDRNPIKQVFANLKALRRTARARGVEAFWGSIGSLMDKSTPDKCERYVNMLAVASQGDSALAGCGNTPSKSRRIALLKRH